MRHLPGRGNGLAYRAFFALPEELQTAEGQPTNALLGFANMMMRLLMDYRPRTVVVAWDEKPAERLELDPEYKAGRRPTPPLLREQQPFFEPIVNAFGYRNVRVPGKEADDVIGTLATRADEDGHRVCVVSTDRDAFQLASDRVCIMMTPRGVADVVVYTPDRIRERYGIGPELIPDFIGLKGDTSDNIKGVPGIGEKTAADCSSSSAAWRASTSTWTTCPARSAGSRCGRPPRTPRSRRCWPPSTAASRSTST